jgi:hypothetical protein
VNANVVEAAVCCAAVLLALTIGYYAGTRRGLINLPFWSTLMFDFEAC